MQLSLDSGDGNFTIRGYGDGWITVNNQDLRHSIVVMPDRLIIDWPPQSFSDLEPCHFERVVEMKPEIVLLGTGARQQFPPPHLTRALADQGIGVEIMNTASACRTYTIIMAEGRRVAAALLIN